MERATVAAGGLAGPGQRTGHRRQRLGLPVGVGDGAGHSRGRRWPASASVPATAASACARRSGSVMERATIRTCSYRYVCIHSIMSQDMRRLLASDLLPKRAGQPARALVHIHFSELLDLDGDSVFQDKWIEDCRARWAAQRAAASVSTGDGGAWLDGDAARRVACEAMIIPVVTGDIDPGAIEALITACVEYHRIRAQAASQHDGTAGQQDDDGAAAAAQAGSTVEVLAMLEHQVLARVLQIVSGPGGVASFLRRNLLGKGLNGPSLPLDVGATDEIPVHLRRLVALRDQTCRHPGGYFL